MSRTAKLADLAAAYDSGGGFGFKNRLINGGMTVDQRYAGAAQTNTSDGIYVLDRWQMYGHASNPSVMSAQRVSPPSPLAGFTYCQKILSLAATTISSISYSSLCQQIEGFNMADLAWGTASASPITLSFWVYSSLTGTFGGSLQNSGRSRSYPFTYTISAANTWEQKTVTIAGDTSGTWLTTNGIGMQVAFQMGVGSTYAGTAGAWAGTAYWGATGAVNMIATNGATFYITGVQLEKGSTATSFDYRPYTTELQLAQRYYFKISGGSGSRLAVGHNLSTVGALCSLSFPVTMRTAPTALETSGTAGDYDIQYLATATTCSAVPTFNAASQYIGSVAFIAASGLTAGQGSNGRSVNTTAYLGWSAEL
jgi:hypothetical protein